VRAAALFLAVALAAGCASLEQAPADAIDLGQWRVSGYILPQDRPSSSLSAAGKVGWIYHFDANRVVWPWQLQQKDCYHRGWRLLPRSAGFLPLFDPRQAGSYSAAEAQLTEDEIFELLSDCTSEIYMNKSRDRIFIPMDGALLLLEPL
jgi:hypothetical protein